jgi:hypothetical protein
MFLEGLIMSLQDVFRLRASQRRKKSIRIATAVLAASASAFIGSVVVQESASAAVTAETLWGTVAPASAVTDADTGAVELGTKFTAKVAGTVTGVRFFKASANTGTHVGNLWSATGTRIATATFAGETASGWQTVNFASPVVMTAGQSYVASYFAPKGRYSATQKFSGTPVGADLGVATGKTGYYTYGSSSKFPASSWDSAMYWVDVNFTPAATATPTAAMLTSYTGSLTVTGRIYQQRIDLGSNQLVLAQGAVLDQVLITGTRNGGQGQVRVTGSDVKIINSDIVGTASATGESMGIYGDNLNNLQISSLRMTGFTIFMWLDSGSSSSTPGSVVDGFYGSAQIDGTSHHDGITRRSGNAPLTVQNSRIALTTGSTTGAVFLQPTYGAVGHVTVTSSYLEGNGYPATVESSNDVTFSNNRFRPTEYGPVTKSGTVTALSWANNYIWANVAPSYQGTSIPTP